ncbi:MAG: carboxypeptidase regulatory-like domain-containing protein [Fimbriimonadaceae bacterium]|nr:MAG: carboxypeptidase regulatory-like domain-containing protein [Fimbriimonadaceae bacterium]
MKRCFALFGAGLATISAILLAGCGGLTGPRTSTVTGTVIDWDFNPMRDARVTAAGKTTYTTSTGSYTLEDLPDGDVEVLAEATVNGTRYYGRTTIFNIENTQQNNVNILVAPENQRATLTGTVRDREGYLLQGASVFAWSGVGSSTRAVTDENGRYTMRDLPANTGLDVSATGRGYRSDQTGVTLSVNQTRTLDFILDNPGLPGLNPPSNINAVTWVTHPTANRGPEEEAAYETVKALFDPKHKKATNTTRVIRTDMSVETELYWDLVQFPDLLGFNIYRGVGSTGSVSPLDLSFDPLSNYYVDIGLNPQSTYSYAVSTVATLYPDYNNTESTLSSRVVVQTLNLLNLNNVTFGPTFNWQSGSGAVDFYIYVFDEYPTGSANVNHLVYSSNAVGGTSWTYSGPVLQSGRTYYYLIVGTANGLSSRTISQVGTFVP